MEDGEITYDDYLLLIESFVGEPYDDLDVDETTTLQVADSVTTVESGRSRPKLTYHGSFQQKLEQERAFVRYDRLACEWGKWRLDLAAELRNQKQLLIRSRILHYRHKAGEIVLGSYDLRLGNGVTLGNASFHSQLHEDNDFGSSLLQPIKNRHNGVLIRQSFGNMRTGFLFSDIKGTDFYRTAAGTFVEFGQSRRSAGVVFLRQQVGRDSGGNVRSEFLAPYFHVSNKELTLSGESSFGLGSSSAHVYQAEIDRNRLRQDLTFFSYSRDYRNLQSGGYAYSDYDDIFIGGIEFEYRDKRAGRFGLATTSMLELSSDANFGVSVVRWNNRLDNRRCAAAKATLSVNSVAGSDNKITVRAIWENLDLTTDSSNRKLLSLTTRSLIGHALELDGQFKYERRQRLETRTSPFSIRADLLWRFAHDLAATVTLRYYNPNVARAANDYLHLAVGQKLTRHKGFSLWVKAQTKYLFDKQRLDIWEARVYCDFAT